MKIPNKFNGYSKDGIRLYNDPMTMAVVGGMAGAAMSPKDPLKGALLGAVGGYGGGAMLGSMGAAGAAGTAGTAGAAGNAAASIAAQPALSYAGAQTAAGSAAAAPTSLLGNTFSNIQTFAKENPFLTDQAGGIAKQVLFPEQQPMAQGPGIIRGQQMAQQQPQYNPFAAPNISLI
jgi:hypothetical protein